MRTWRVRRARARTPASWSSTTCRAGTGPTKEIFTKDLQCPLLGLFGVEDTRPSPDDTVKTKAELDRYGKTYEFHTYDNAGHAFFAVDRPNYRQHAAVDGWKKVFAWFEKYLH
jgi:dienelactone hydrolase